MAATKQPKTVVINNARTTHTKPPHSIRFPKPLISFQKLFGGQFGTLDVSVDHKHYVQLALGGDFVALTRQQWITLRTVVDRAFGTEGHTVVLTDAEGRPISFERDDVVEVQAEEVDEEEVEIETPPPAPPKRPRRRAAAEA